MLTSPFNTVRASDLCYRSSVAPSMPRAGQHLLEYSRTHSQRCAYWRYPLRIPGYSSESHMMDASSVDTCTLSLLLSARLSVAFHHCMTFLICISPVACFLFGGVSTPEREFSKPCNASNNPYLHEKSVANMGFARNMYQFQVHASNCSKIALLVTKNQSLHDSNYVIPPPQMAVLIICPI